MEQFDLRAVMPCASYLGVAIGEDAAAELCGRISARRDEHVWNVNLARVPYFDYHFISTFLGELLATMRDYTFIVSCRFDRQDDYQIRKGLVWRAVPQLPPPEEWSRVAGNLGRYVALRDTADAVAFQYVGTVSTEDLDVVGAIADEELVTPEKLMRIRSVNAGVAVDTLRRLALQRCVVALVDDEGYVPVPSLFAT